MANANSRKTERVTAENSADGPPERLMQRRPSYVKLETAPQGEAAGHRRRSGEDQGIPQESLADRIARDRQEEEPLTSLSDFRSAPSQFTFKNTHWSPIFYAFTGWDEACESDCGYKDYVSGWYELAPAETHTWSNPGGAWRFFYYAEATDGRVYDGDYIHALVMDVPFEVCLCNEEHIPTGQSPWYEVGFEELDFNQYSGVEFY